MQTERITILATPAAKRDMTARASARGLSLGEYVRRRALDDDDVTSEQKAEFANLVAQVNAAAPVMQATLDRLTTRLEAMTRKNEAFLKQMGIGA